MNPRFLFVALLAWAAPAAAETPLSEAPASVAIQGVDDSQWTLGTPGVITVMIQHWDHTAVHFPKRPHLGAHLRLTGHRSTREVGTEGRVTTRHVLEIIALRPGRQQLAPIEIAFVRGTDATTLSTPLATLTIARKLVNESQPTLRAPSEPRSIEVTNKPLLYALIALAAAVFGALIALFVIRFLGPALRQAPRLAPPLPPHVVALERLEKLRRSPWLDAGEFEAWFVELTDIVREYFSNRYRILALAETTTELIAQLDERAPAGLDRVAVAELLAEADLIKFARQESARNAAETALGTVHAMVEETRQREVDEDNDPIPDWEPPRPAPARLRAAAFIVDLAVLGGASAILLFLPLPSGLAPFAGGLSAILLSVLISLRDLPGRSLGKRALHLELVHEEAPCPPPSAGARVRRNLVLAIPVFGMAIESTWLPLDPESRRIGDRWTHSIVVERGALDASRQVHLVRERMLEALAKEEGA